MIFKLSNVVLLLCTAWVTFYAEYMGGISFSWYMRDPGVILYSLLRCFLEIRATSAHYSVWKRFHNRLKYPQLGELSPCVRVIHVARMCNAHKLCSSGYISAVLTWDKHGGQVSQALITLWCCDELGSQSLWPPFLHHSILYAVKHQHHTQPLLLGFVRILLNGCPGYTRPGGLSQRRESAFGCFNRGGYLCN